MKIRLILLGAIAALALALAPAPAKAQTAAYFCSQTLSSGQIVTPNCQQISASTWLFANASSIGTTVNKLAKITGAPSTAVVPSTSDTGGVIGIVTSGAGTSGNAVVQTNGLVSCIFDGATTAGHYVQISSGTAGDCHDAGSAYPTSGQVIGRILSTNGSGGTYQIALFSAESVNAGASTGVSSFNSRTGAVMPQTGDYTCAQVTSCGSGSGGGTAFNITASPYNAVGDGSTDNSAGIAAVFTGSNAITSGTPTVYFPCQAGKQCQYNFTDSGSTSPINPTIPTTIQCDPGVILDDTGSAHIIDIGDGTTYYAGKFRVTGCKFVGASVTAGIYINAGSGYNEIGEIDHNEFFNFPVGSTAITGTGSIFNWNFNSNYYDSLNGVAGSFLNIGAGGGSENQVQAYGNLISCAGGTPPLVSGCTSSGAGIVVSGYGSMVSDNYVVSMNPDIQVLSSGINSHISGDNFESAVYGNHPAITFGTSGDGSNTAVSGVTLDKNYIYMHTSAPVIAPVTGNDLMVNWHINNNPIGGSQTQIASLNATVGQTGNQSFGNTCGGNPCGIPFTALHIISGNAVTPEPWLALDNLHFVDTFQRANGALGSPWVATGNLPAFTISSDALTSSCAGTCANEAGVDIVANQDNEILLSTVPTGSDDVLVGARLVPTNSYTTWSLYFCRYTAGTGVVLYSDVAGTEAQLGSTYTTTTPANGQWLWIKTQGTLISCGFTTTTGNVTAVTAIDASITQGYPYIEADGTTGVIGAFKSQGLP